MLDQKLGLLVSVIVILADHAIRQIFCNRLSLLFNYNFFHKLQLLEKMTQFFQAHWPPIDYAKRQEKTVPLS